MSNRSVSSALSSVLVLGGLFSQLVACGGGTVTPVDDGGTDGGTVVVPDAFVERDAPMRDAARRVDSGVDTFDLQEAAFDGYINAICTCEAERDPETTVAECLVDNAGDTIIEPCDEVGYRASAGLFDTYAYCRADALQAAEDCIAASDCSEAAVTACNTTLRSANTTCGMLITDPAREAYTPPFNMCIDDMFRGPDGECPESLTAVSGIGPSVFSGSTTLQGDDTRAECDMTMGSYAPDRGYLWAAPATGNYTIDTIGSEFDTILYVRDECLSADSIACNDDIEAGIMRASTVDVFLTMGQEVVIIVDGWRNEHGNFVVNITPGAAVDAGVGLDAGVGTDAATDMDAGVDAAL